MKFTIEYTGKTEERVLIYRSDECSFDIDPVEEVVHSSISINKLNLTVIKTNGENKVIEVLGFCPYGAWKHASYKVPNYRQGTLKVLYDFEPQIGVVYGFNDEDWREYVNLETGWVCIGDPTKNEYVVEFIRNCVAVLEGEELVALWLKPESLPTKEILDFERS